MMGRRVMGKASFAELQDSKGRIQVYIARDEFVKDYLSIMDSLRAANPKVRFILARMTPIADRHPRFISGTKQWHGEIQSAIETVARVSGAELIDFHEPLYPYPNLLPDAIHPNPEGAGILAKTVYGGITGNYGGLQMSQLYTDYMVLQRNVPLDIHGTANAGEKITVSIGNQTSTAPPIGQPTPCAYWNILMRIDPVRKKQPTRQTTRKRHRQRRCP